MNKATSQTLKYCVKHLDEDNKLETKPILRSTHQLRTTISFDSLVGGFNPLVETIDPHRFA
jgi:hypothetical protein